MSALFHTYLYLPTVAALSFIYNTIAFHDLGFAIIFLTIFVRVVLFPVFYKGAKDQALMQRIQPHIKKIQLDHKDDKERQAQEMLSLYKKYKLNPFSGILLLILQLPVFIVLFQVFSKELSTGIFATTTFLGFIDLGTKGYLMPIVAGIAQYIQTKLMMGAQKDTTSDNPMAGMAKTMSVIGPAFTLLILINLPTALSVYWTVSGIFSIFQQMYINKRLPKFEDE
ncbi:MAG: YidC/Oxa1 family membrane protein insertase [Candidatus Jorgensenbacteria bacterium]|nr:YidC/Oxa1 family membrane protein insertase [Candidatus Jorgensenbacteria bacterium]